MLKKKKFKLVTNVLTVAIKFWLRTQVSHIGQLKLDIQAGDRQLFVVLEASRINMEITVSMITFS